MIVAPQTPWQRLAPHHRPLLLLAMTLISISGLVTGLALRPLVLNWSKHSITANRTVSTTSTAPQGTTSPVNSATTPGYFSAIMCAPAVAQPGGSFTLTAYAAVGKLSDHPPCQITATMKAASGVNMSISFAAASGIPAPAPQTTGTDGTVTWTVPIPSTTRPGSYRVSLRATWGTFAANWLIFATVAA